MRIFFSIFSITKKWITDNVDISDFELFMRKNDDNRKDNITKKEIYVKHINQKYYIKFVLDDRDSVVEMWRNMGLTCLQVASGNF